MIKFFRVIGSKLQLDPGVDETHWFDPADHDLRRSTCQLVYKPPSRALQWVFRFSDSATSDLLRNLA
jgi:hypothetical protein